MLVPLRRGMVMAVTARIIGCSLLTAALGAFLGLALFGYYTWYGTPTLLLACVGAIVGAVAGAAGEIVTAQRRLTKPEPQERMSKTREAGD